VLTRTAVLWAPIDGCGNGTECINKHSLEWKGEGAMFVTRVYISNDATFAIWPDDGWIDWGRGPSINQYTPVQLL